MGEENKRLTYFIKAVEEHLEKCSVTLKAIRTAIAPMVEEIVDNDDEKELFLDVIPRYYRDCYGQKNERCLIQDYSGQAWENKAGDSMHVEIPFEASMTGMFMGVLFSIHNHPNSVSLLSGGDYGVLASMNEKYSVVVADNDITIVKNTSGRRVGGVDEDRIMSVDRIRTNKHLQDLSKNKTLNQIRDDYYSGKINGTQRDQLTEDALRDYFRGIYPEEVKAVDKNFSDNNVPVKVVGTVIEKRY